MSTESLFKKAMAMVSDPSQRQTRWGRWVGTAIIADLLGVWSYHCVKNGVLESPDPVTLSIIVCVFVVNSFTTRSVQPTQPTKTNEKETT